MILNKVKRVIARTFNIHEDDVTPELGYQKISQWDSLNHIHLMLALEKEFNIKVDEDFVLDLISVPNICNFLENKSSTKEKLNNKECQSQLDVEKVHRGLNGIIYDYSSICLIDGDNGRLYYRGYAIEELADNYSFEEIVSLLILKNLPDLTDLNSLKSELYQIQKLPDNLINLIREIKDFEPVHVIKVVMSYYLGVTSSLELDNSDDGIKKIAFRVLNIMPLIVGQHNLFRNNIDKFAELNLNWSYAKNVLYFLTLKEPQDEIVNYFDKDLILHAEHNSNASTFVARICASTKAEPLNALIAAISCFSGELHGGALEKVSQMIKEIGKPEHVEKYIHKRLENKLPIYGYGHRIYRTLDPRAKYMDKVAKQLSVDKGFMDDYEILHRINDCMKPYSEHGIYPNVDFYDAVIYRLLDIPDDLFLPAFIISRVAGWFAHLEEQYSNNILIRPKLKFKD